MKQSNIAKKVQESLKRKRQKEINELREIRDAKKKLWEVITNDDYHPSWHERHWKGK